VDGKEWIWCTKHKKWGAHTTEDCKGQGIGSNGAGNKKQATSGSDKKSNKTAGNPRLVQARKATSVRFSDLPDDSSDDE
jgi:hypothetical protein